MDPFAAIRGGSDVHIDDELAEGVMADREDLRREAQRLDLLTEQIGSLKWHSGWQEMRKKFQEDIDKYRSGRSLQGILKDAAVSDATVGHWVRLHSEVAELLAKKLAEVEADARLIEEQRAKYGRK